MENVTDQTSNPFGMRPPCPARNGPAAAHGYGDANADFHIIGDHPGIHGGLTTGIPFTETEAGRRLQAVFHDFGFFEEPYSDSPSVDNVFMSYLYLCCRSEGPAPTDAEYADYERFFDAEFRAINAHVLFPVGQRAIAHVLDEFTARAHLLDSGIEHLHAQEITGRGYVVIPILDPAEWQDGDETALREQIEQTVTRDYRQIVDLGRYLATDEPYFVR